ncbi:hypothetical protein SapgrDRAFT_1824 [Saprospira grandis DSM 2844]|uniref:Uncharacterized protein n=1 Tax=Saprospira grandis DSM 2844 TaxID=694433 RepID=J0P7M6_9BACT|nr:hypothetical protein [Saprospira grandis]EJF53527.1 hypothetical protein SapgrDRAFT_1824 [Saprospira grandis DSM 2844]
MNITVQKQTQSLLIKKKWAAQPKLFLFGFLFSSGPLLLLYLPFAENDLALSYFFIAIFIAIGCLCFYLGLAQSLNHSFILVEKEQLSSWSSPLPLSPKQLLSRKNIQQIYILPKGQIESGHFILAYQTTDDWHRFLLGDFLGQAHNYFQLSLREAQQLEQLIEEFWEIEDAPLEEELQNQQKNHSKLESATTESTLQASLSELIHEHNYPITIDLHENELFILKTSPKDQPPIFALFGWAFGLIGLLSLLIILGFLLKFPPTDPLPFFSLILPLCFIAIALALIRKNRQDKQISLQIHLKQDQLKVRYNGQKRKQELSIPKTQIQAIFTDQRAGYFIHESQGKSSKVNHEEYFLSLLLKNQEYQEIHAPLALTISKEESQFLAQLLQQALIEL